MHARLVRINVETPLGHYFLGYRIDDYFALEIGGKIYHSNIYAAQDVKE